MTSRSYILSHRDHPHYIADEKITELKDKFANTSQYSEVASILKNLSDPTKLSIYLLLHQIDEIPVTDICLILNMNQSAVSHALSDLKKLGLVANHRCGQLICYSLKRRLPQLSSMFKKIFI